MDDNINQWARNAISAAPEGRSFSYAEAHEDVIAFEEVLSARGIKIAPGSKLEAACLLTMELHEQQRDPARRSPIPKLRDELRHVIGLIQLVRLVLHLQRHPDFEALVAHLRVLNEGSPTQNTPTGPEDQASNKLFELLVALAVMGAGRAVQLDDPKAADGRNPDVLATMPEGKRWGFACKVVHGDAPMTLFERILDGVEQIERSSADTGLVVVNFKNRLPHDELLPLMEPDPETGEIFIGAHVSPGAVALKLAAFVQARTIVMESHVGRDPIVAAFRGKKALPGLLVVAEAAAGVMGPRGPSPSMVGFLDLTTFELPGDETRFTPDVDVVLQSMNAMLQLQAR